MTKFRLSKHLSRITIPVHLLVALGLYSIGIDWYALPLIILGWILIAGVGTAIGHHRLFSHKGFPVTRRMELFILGCSIYAGQGSTVFWKALHVGYHHPYSDTEKDLHSPVNGWFQSYIGWLNKAEFMGMSMMGAKELTRDKAHQFVHRNYYSLFWFPIIILGAISPEFVLYFILIPSLISQHQENIVNLTCHIKGFGGYSSNTKDNSINRPILALFTWGEALHSNHHAVPRAFDFKMRRFEFDPCTLLIPLLRKR